MGAGSNGVSGKGESYGTIDWNLSTGKYVGDNAHLASAAPHPPTSPPDTSRLRIDPTTGQLVMPGQPDYPFGIDI